ncbi:MAG: glycosyl hydrolase, partial [Calditrichaeota bacterium]|nr:glycosyl hydrolase [Calditrichota bacterium]
SRMYDIVFADGVNGWAVGQNGTILHSGDGGESWSSQASGTSSRLYGIHFLSAETGFAVG